MAWLSAASFQLAESPFLQRIRENKTLRYAAGGFVYRRADQTETRTSKAVLELVRLVFIAHAISRLSQLVISAWMRGSWATKQPES